MINKKRRYILREWAEIVSGIRNYNDGFKGSVESKAADVPEGHFYFKTTVIIKGNTSGLWVSCF